MAQNQPFPLAAKKSHTPPHLDPRPKKTDIQIVVMGLRCRRPLLDGDLIGPGSNERGLERIITTAAAVQCIYMAGNPHRETSRSVPPQYDPDFPPLQIACRSRRFRRYPAADLILGHKKPGGAEINGQVVLIPVWSQNLPNLPAV